MKKVQFVIGLLLAVVSIKSHGQSSTSIEVDSCEKFKNRDIQLAKIVDEFEAFVPELSNLSACGLDKIDLMIISAKEVFDTYLHKELESVYTKNEKLKGQDFLEAYSKFQQTDDYTGMRSAAINMEIFFDSEVDTANWSGIEQLLMKMHSDEEGRALIRSMTYNYNEFKVTYRQLLVYLEDRDFQKLYNSVYSDRKVDISPDSINRLCSTEGNPILIYFSSPNSINARKVESNLLINKKIYAKIADKYSFVELTCEARKEDPVDMAAVILAEKNLKYQIQIAGNNIQPCFIIMDEQGKVLKAIEYIESRDSFLDFLE